MDIYEIMDKFPYGIVVLEGNYVKHICLYPEEPTLVDCDGLIEELQTDPEHGLVGVDLSSMDFCPASGDLLKNAIKAYSS